MGDKEMSDNNISDKNTFTAEVKIEDKSANITGDFEIADFLSEKDVYEELFRCRDFELSHLWQRSVFLATFILGLAVAYGTLAIKILFPEENNCINDIHHIAAVGLCILGIVFSFLWIMMAKGSKYWSEKYESAITGFYWNNPSSSKINDDTSFYGNLPLPNTKKISSSIFSPMAWCFSPSRINAVIGIVALFAWSSLNAVHVGLLIKIYCNELQSNNIALALLGVAATFIIDTVILCILWGLCETGEYNDKKDNIFSNIHKIIKISFGLILFCIGVIFVFCRENFFTHIRNNTCLSIISVIVLSIVAIFINYKINSLDKKYSDYYKEEMKDRNETQN